MEAHCTVLFRSAHRENWDCHLWSQVRMQRAPCWNFSVIHSDFAVLEPVSLGLAAAGLETVARTTRVTPPPLPASSDHSQPLSKEEARYQKALAAVLGPDGRRDSSGPVILAVSPTEAAVLSSIRQARPTSFPTSRSTAFSQHSRQTAFPNGACCMCCYV